MTTNMPLLNRSEFLECLGLDGSPRRAITPAGR